MKLFLSGIALLAACIATAQDTSTNKSVSGLSFGGYIEAYYSYDFNRPADNNRPAFIYSHNRHNEFNVNLAFLKASYAGERIRANIALATGTYMNANYAAETGVLKNIFEANAGYKISRSKNIWIDIGALPSHIGWESSVSKDCWTLTRSLSADNSPYFETGARLGYTSEKGKLSVNIMALNGWQRIARVNGNSLVSWGTQVTVKPSGKITLNYSAFLGSDKPDSVRLLRTYHNLYGIFQLTDKIGCTAGLDIGTEQQQKGSGRINSWYSPVGILRYTPNSVWAIALRGEYFSDKKGALISNINAHGFTTAGYSMNVDYAPIPNAVLRLEGRMLRAKDPLFIKGDALTKNAMTITFSLAVSF